MTGFWKTDRIVTLGLFHFIGPTNGYICTLYIHSAITRLGWLVCFSKANLADPVNSWLIQWDPWGVLHGRHGSEIQPSDGETSLTPFKHVHVWAYCWHFWDPWLAQTVPTEGISYLWLSTHLLHLPFPSCPPTPYNMPSVLLQWFWKSCWKSSSVS